MSRPAMVSRRSCLLAGALSSPILAAYAQAERRHRVLTALPAIHALTVALCTGTAIDVVRLPSEEAIPMEGQANALSRLGAQAFGDAEAVVALSRLWRADPLFPTARRHNLRIIDIDASYSWNAGKPGLAVMRVPQNSGFGLDPGDTELGLSPYAWLSPINAMRMAAIVSDDLARLSPSDTGRIKRNLAALEARIRRLKADYGARVAKLPDPRLVSLAGEFVYLFEDFGIFVDGWFVKQDIDWSDADCTAFTTYLRERGVRVVAHKWMPNDSILSAAKDGGARLLVLDAGNPGLLADEHHEYVDLVRFNLDALLSAFEK